MRRDAFAVAILMWSVFAGAERVEGQQEPTPLSPTAGIPIIEPHALDLLKQNQQAMYRLRTYRAECGTTITPDKPRPNHPSVTYFLATLTAARPKMLRYDHWEPKSDPVTSGWKLPEQAPKNCFVSDGKSYWQQLGTTYRKYDEVTLQNMMTGALEPWDGFYDPRMSTYAGITAAEKKGELREARVVGQEEVEGVLCDKISIVLNGEYNSDRTEDRQIWYLGPDHLTRRCIWHHDYGKPGYPGYTRDSTLHHIEVNPPTRPQEFTYNPPPGVTPEQPPQDLLANGTMAPDFTALDARKRPVKLSDFRGKVVVLDFWASWCAPCMASMPHNQKIIQTLQASHLPVVMLAMDDGEERTAFEAWLTQKAAAYPALTFLHSPPALALSGNLFRVTGIPTQYVVDQAGVIRASFVGFDSKSNALEEAVRACLSTSK
jgi:thiol-disulfide isomerase/thioredoxin